MYLFLHKSVKVVDVALSQIFWKILENLHFFHFWSVARKIDLLISRAVVNYIHQLMQF